MCLCVDLTTDFVYYCNMVEVNVHEAKTHLSRLLLRVAAGEEVLISKAGQPVARLVPVAAPKTPRPLGLDAGRFHVPDDFNAPLPDEVLTAFEGRS
jgi:prevent-host-death family protein